ncbi:MAG: SCO family protein [Bacteroidota bacterium]
MGLAVALLLPLSFYWYGVYIVRDAVSSKKIHLPYYYITDKVDTTVVNGKPQYDTVYHQAADVQLTNLLGQLVSINNDLKGKVILVDFFFANCTTICPRLTRGMALMQRAFRRTESRQSDTLLQLISMTVNPTRDSFPALRAYADRYGANHDRWWFLTGPKPLIYNYARHELHVTVEPGDGGDDDFIHTEKVVLLDKDRFIRGYYNGLDSADMKRCADDIILLTVENKHKKNNSK